VKEHYSRYQFAKDVYAGLPKPKPTLMPREKIWLIKRDMPRPTKKQKDSRSY
jgi:hypothetical protein